jgi:hypothetical protein
LRQGGGHPRARAKLVDEERERGFSNFFEEKRGAARFHHAVGCGSHFEIWIDLASNPNELSSLF